MGRNRGLDVARGLRGVPVAAVMGYWWAGSARLVKSRSRAYLCRSADIPYPSYVIIAMCDAVNLS